MFNTDIYLWTDDEGYTFSKITSLRSENLQLASENTKQWGYFGNIVSGIGLGLTLCKFECNRDSNLTLGLGFGWTAGSSSEYASWKVEEFQLTGTNLIGLDIYVDYTTSKIIFGWKSSVPYDAKFTESLNFSIEQFLNKTWGLPLVKSDNQFEGRFIVDIDNRFEIILNPDSQYDIRALLDEDAIKQAISNIFLIKQGEVPMYPYVGTAIYRWLFEKVDETNANLLKLEVEKEIIDNEPAIYPEKIEVIPEPEYRRYRIIVEWRLDELNLRSQYTFTVRSE